MRCPKCKNQLIEGKYQVYETLVEHVINPNGIRSSKPTLICPNKCYGKKAFWDEYGDSYPYFKWYAKILRWFGIWKGFVSYPEAIKD